MNRLFIFFPALRTEWDFIIWYPIERCLENKFFGDVNDFSQFFYFILKLTIPTRKIKNLALETNNSAIEVYVARFFYEVCDLFDIIDDTHC